ncbi:carcinine hydrolase/isopenicillin-N N-acyltransferase family protein [Maribacter sp. 2-571]|uniref:carcinine hydrolase/isopenicillin-N N-acyltransferase family protein n=1 Tax=Maribacter sp. 2-571 TaxID=3417569 RepID=UPI003D3480C3
MALLRTFILLFLPLLFCGGTAFACSVFYYIDEATGNIYAVNNEDYFYDTDAYIQVQPAKGKKFARLWYGWDDFAQGGINEKGLFFDGAVTPGQERPKGYKGPKGNLGDRILASCGTVAEALAYLERKKIALDNAHMMFGDRLGNAVVVEWVNGKRNIVRIKENRLLMTNFNLSDTAVDGISCPRYLAIDKELQRLQSLKTPVDLKMLGNAGARGVQVPMKTETGRRGGTLYSSFINISEMKMILVYQLDNEKTTQLDLNEIFAKNTARTIPLE